MNKSLEVFGLKVSNQLSELRATCENIDFLKIGGIPRL